mgnify:CR=1 FL=1
MHEEEIKKIKELAGAFQRINGKVILLSLLRKAKNEYDKFQFAQCKASCEEILKANSTNSSALRGLGCVEQAEGNLKKAIEYYKKALENSEHKEIEYTLIGMAYYLQEDFENAIENYNLAIDINDDYDKAYEGKNQAMLERHVQILDLQDSLIKREKLSWIWRNTI